MTAIRTIAVAVGACAAEVVTILLFFMAAAALLAPDSIRDGSHGVRLSGAVAAFILWSVPGVAVASIATRLGARRCGASVLGALCIVGAFNILVSCLFLAYTTMLNECIWNVSFPLGGNGECAF